MDAMKRGRGQPRKYDWDGLLRRGTFTMRHGVHYACAPSSLVQQLRNAASLRGLHLQVEADGDGTIRVKVLKEEQTCPK